MEDKVGVIKIQVLAEGRIGLINLPKYFDFTDKNNLQEKLPVWIKQFSLTLILFNFSETEFIGSSGVYPLFQYLTEKDVRLGRKKVRYAIIGLCPEYVNLLEGMGIKKKFFLYNTSVVFAQQAHRVLKLSKTEARSILEWL